MPVAGLVPHPTNQVCCSAKCGLCGGHSAFARFKTSYGIISRHVSDANKLNVMPTSRMRMTGWNGQL